MTGKYVVFSRNVSLGNSREYSCFTPLEDPDLSELLRQYSSKREDGRRYFSSIKNLAGDIMSYEDMMTDSAEIPEVENYSGRDTSYESSRVVLVSYQGLTEKEFGVFKQSLKKAVSQ